jgi:hypothetical protein
MLVGSSDYLHMLMSDECSVGCWLSRATMLLAEPAMSGQGPERYYSFQTLHPSRSTDVSTNPYFSFPFGGLFFGLIFWAGLVPSDLGNMLCGIVKTANSKPFDGIDKLRIRHAQVERVGPAVKREQEFPRLYPHQQAQSGEGGEKYYLPVVSLTCLSAASI